ncbi:hypothetical protein BC629DRAFT_915771 [Irpex lacteus]|nr:hypothetical protein BC629DRAFT_915771 [Irpex lacteus]
MVGVVVGMDACTCCIRLAFTSYAPRLRREMKSSSSVGLIGASRNFVVGRTSVAHSNALGLLFVLGRMKGRGRYLREGRGCHQCECGCRTHKVCTYVIDPLREANRLRCRCTAHPLLLPSDTKPKILGEVTVNTACKLSQTYQHTLAIRLEAPYLESAQEFKFSIPGVVTWEFCKNSSEGRSER